MGELVRPDDGFVKYIAPDHACKQNHDLGDDQERCRDLDQIAQHGVYRHRPVSSCRREGVGYIRRADGFYFGVYASAPVYFSSVCQASSPNLAFQSL